VGWTLYRLDCGLLAVLLALGGWNAAQDTVGVWAVSMSQTARIVVGVRATTSELGTVTADHQGTSLHLLGGPAATQITPSATDAAVEFHLADVPLAAYVHRIRFESTAQGDDIPAGALDASWTVGGTQQTARLAIAGVAVAAADRGGFTVVVPGTTAEGPKNIRVIYQ